MGYFSNLFMRDDVTAPRNNVVDLGIQSPWAEPGDLGRIVLSDLIGADIAEQLPMTRGEALSIPAVAAAFNLLMASVASLPLVALDRDGNPLAEQPSVLTRQNAYPLYAVKGGLVSDCMFVGHSLLRCVLGADGFPLSMEHIDLDRWKRDEKGRWYIDGKLQNADEMFLVQSLYPGLLNIGGRTLRAARDIELTIAQRSRNSAPINVLKQINGEPLLDEQREDVLRQFNGVAHTPGGATVFLPDGVDFNLIADNPSNFLLEARNATANDVARLLGMPSSLLESTAGVTSLDYTTEKGQRSRFEDFSLNLWLDAIESRLSQADFSPSGQRIAFDTTQLTGTTSPTAGPDVYTPAQTPAPVTETPTPEEQA